ncbi:HAD superfamily [Sesbania bispinosa]|nr:HAD superfamily [Sesbania bispinosa]
MGDVSTPGQKSSANLQWKHLKLLFILLKLIQVKRARNVASGKAAGLNTVIVGRSDLVPGADHALNNIHNIKEALPEIWEAEGDQQQMIHSSGVETMVLA